MTIDVCNADANTGNYYKNSIYRVAKNYPTNIELGKCPYDEGFYYLRNFSVNAKMLRLLPVPDNVYMSTLDAYDTAGSKQILMCSGKFKLRLYQENDRRKKTL